MLVTDNKGSGLKHGVIVQWRSRSPIYRKLILHVDLPVIIWYCRTYSNKTPPWHKHSTWSRLPSRVPSRLPSRVPSRLLSRVPSRLLSRVPSRLLSQVPSRLPCRVPSSLPSGIPSRLLSQVSSRLPSRVPSRLLSRVHVPFYWSTHT